jgi:type IV pilus assembly protein PilA
MSPPAKKGLSTGAIVAIVLSAIFVFLCVLGALAYSGFTKYVAAAKASEAKATVSAIGRAAAAAYEQEGPDPATPHALCPSAAAVPADLRQVGGVKYMSKQGPGQDWDEPGWRCLRFRMETPQYYQYQYNQGGHYLSSVGAPGPRGFEAAARGDLDGDGTTSLFTLTGEVGANGMLRLADGLRMEREDE